MTSQEIYETMEAHWLTFKENHDRFQEKRVKKAAGVARKRIDGPGRCGAIATVGHR